MRIRVESAEVTRTVSNYNNVEKVRWTQWAQLSQGGFVLSFTVSHNHEDEALAPGEYQLDPTSFSSKNGRLAVEYPRLMPMPKPPQQAKA
jgi:hypothetical protein